MENKLLAVVTFGVEDRRQGMGVTAWGDFHLICYVKKI